MPGVNRGSILIVFSSPSGADDIHGGYDENAKESRLLKSILTDAGLSSEHTSIGYATRCYGRKANSSDIDACRAHLKSQIEALQPSAIIALGQDALKSLTKLSGVKDKRGGSFPLHAVFGYECLVYPTYGLDEIIRVPTFRKVVTSDFRRVRDKDMPEDFVPFEFFQVGDKLPFSETWAFDGEWATGGKIVDYFTMLSCSNGAQTYVAVGETNIRHMLDGLLWAAKNGTELITHNGWSADLPIARKWGYEMPYGTDTMVLAYLEDETQPLKLESLCVKHLGVPGWKNDSWEDFDPSSFAAAQYAARDSRYTYRLYYKLSGLLGKRVRTHDLILRPARIALDHQTQRGIWIDPVPVARERKIAEEGKRDSLAALRSMYGQVYGEKSGSGFNPGSSKQVGEYLQAVGEVLPRTDSGKPATGIEVLKSIDNPFTQKLIEYRSHSKTLSTYVVPYEATIATGDGRVHPDFTIVRTLTGRSSARNLNVQNLDRDLKGFFFAPPGHTFLAVDYSAIEFRLAAWFAREETILERFAKNPDWDPHFFLASMFYKKDFKNVSSQLTGWETWQQKPLKTWLKTNPAWAFRRQIAKSANFGLMFLGNQITLHDYANKSGVKMDLQTANDIYYFWHNTFPGFAKFYHDVRQEIETTGQSACPTGHVRHFGDWSLLLPHMRGEALRQAVNVKVQNFAAHLAYIAMAELDRLGYPMVGFVHDSFFFDFPSEAEAHAAKPIIEQVMCDYPRKYLLDHFNVNLDIPLAVEFEERTNNGRV
jgi:uracil-DNA glycosylase family 4